MKTSARLLLLLAALAAPASAAQTGASFLRIDTGARPAAMGGAYTALADDVSALYYNPGGLPQLTKRELGATHTEWLLGSKFDFVGYAHPTKSGTFGVGMTRLTSGAFEGRAADRSATGGFTAADTAVGVSFGRRLKGLEFPGATSAGATVKFLESRIGADRASTFAFDLGAVHRLEKRPLSLGVSVLNLGPGLRFIDQTDPLPLMVSVGASYRLGGVLGVALDVRQEPHEGRLDVGVGTEYALLSSFFLRAGYASVAPAGVGGSPLTGLGAGFGVRTAHYRADYTFTPFGTLGNAQRISLGARF